MIDIGFTATLFAIALWAFANIVAKRLAVKLGNILPSITMIALGVLPIVITMALGNFAVKVTYFSIATAVSAGLFLFVGFFLIYRSLETEQLTNAYVLSEVQPALLVTFGLLILGQKITTIEAVGISVIFLGVLFVITTEGLRLNKRLIPALLANVSFTAYWILMNYSITSSADTFTPLVISRIMGLVIAVLYLSTVLKKGHAIKLPRFRRSELALSLIALVLLGGFLDGSGDIAFSIIIKSNYLTLGSALSALTPMVVAILSYFIYKDRMNGMQFFGFLIMVAGAVALSLF
ncbi:MAG: DMT family transporter [Candidatus Micrarchaeota archaeon]|nr:DMT family transporter [Candidatus Micrarchaeota archaeon]MDE1823688.1 DMT family transporter [Candidatus Micrarchaeota archaeon]